jgi:ribonuclease BN (tRNA processing enzyme)
VAVEAGDDPPIILDLGTGLRPLGLDLDSTRDRTAPLHLSAFLSHLHWDHIIGLPFFTTAHDPLTTLDIYGPPQEDGMTLHEVFDRVLHPPFFPVHVKELRGDIRLKEAFDETVTVGSAKVTVRKVPHVGTTLGFRIEADGASVAFVSDHQQPKDPTTVDPGVLELCDGVDLLIHDAQYTPEDFVMKADWGHSTIAYAVHVAREAGVRKLALFHHDPLRTDDAIDELLEQARALDEATSIGSIVAASEGLTLEVAQAPESGSASYLANGSNGHLQNGNGSVNATDVARERV